ncbi:GCN5 family acetyltransferase [Bacillus sp. FJAT-27916]|uniref:GNAT family N-acetyltransferase n=1 Tax=Bacillaceae TaxID=186817 RepID=UPI0006714EA1|nr:GNAT family N-acetyltransferase [Bacillus sp. FJAT-27916]KMY42924.1 GCN5 family acetyltransferase [Bacillus sp. FJAT-27916]
MDIVLYENTEHADWNEMREIYASVGWTKHTNERIKHVFEASNVMAIAKADGRIIGFGRAMSDGVFNAAIYDIVVHRDNQGMGVARAVMKNLLEQLKDVSCVHLLSTTGNEDFYRQFGMRKLKTGMGRYLNPALANQYLEE